MHRLRADTGISTTAAPFSTAGGTPVSPDAGSRATYSRDRFPGRRERPCRWPSRRSESGEDIDDHQVLVTLRGPRRSGRHGPGCDSREPAPLPERAPRDGVLQDRGAREVHGPARLRHALARRAPFPARRLRVHPEHPDGGGASRARDRAPADRLRLQHLPDVASAAPGRGLCHRRRPHRRPGDSSGSGAATTPARSRPSAAS